MKRISSQLPTFDSNYYQRLREFDMNEMYGKIGGQTRINKLRDDPLAASRSSRFQSEILREGRYGKNIEAVQGTLATAEGDLRSALDILQRVRELGVQGANGTLDKTQMGYLGKEVDQLLGELLTIANTKDQNGNYLFSGTLSRSTPFRTTNGRVPGGEGDLVTSVDYMGNTGRNAAEISEGDVVGINIPGNVAFWAEQQQIYSTVDGTQYRVQRDQTIRIDGAEIHLSPGDTMSAISAKINDADVSVRARIDPVANSLVLESTVPHQIWAEDLGDGTVLQDLGILAPSGGPGGPPGGSHPPLNVSPSARVFGGSIFDMVIGLRNALLAGDGDKVGGAGLRGIENSITNLAGVLGDVGARDARLTTTARRIEYQKPVLVGFESQEHDLDMADAITQLKMLEYSHEAALSSAARALNRPKLLDFLR
ncbi:MAG TPA: flagellar hook-associated protein 3 [Spirochaetia bacterium]|nr:flagellar hook-associated protein 3 [Spirochaetia bacterium]